MATVVSLTQTKIEELMAGWLGVSLTQDQISALVSQLYTDVSSQGASLEHFNEIVVPGLLADVSAADLAIDDLVTNQIPDLDLNLSQNDLAIENLNTVTLPLLDERVHTNELWVIDLNETILPELYTQLDANNVLITEFNTVTLPALNTRLDEAEAAVAAIDLTGLQTDLDAAEAAINTLNTVTLPGLDTRLDTAEAALTTAASALTTLQTDLDTAEGAITTLNTTTLPGLNTRLTTAEGSVTGLQGKFPVTGPDIAANAITSNKIAADQITAREIAAGVVTAAEIAADTITANQIAANAITTNELAANAVTAAKIAADTITANEIAANAITTTELAALAVTAAKIAADTITANEIASNAITVNELAANAVTAVKISAGAVIAGKIAADAVTATEIAANAVTSAKINAGAVVAGKIAADTVTANEIAANAVTSAKINAGAVIAGKIAADAVTANEIAANAVTATEIAAGAVIAGKIAADAVTANEIAAGAVTATEIAAGTITSNEIAAGTITGVNIQASAISSDHIDARSITGDLFSAEVILSGIVRAGDLDANGAILNGYSEIGPRGIVTVNTLGSVIVSFPTNAAEGAYLKAHVDLLSANVMNNFTLRGLNNAIATGSALEIAVGVDAPTVPPTVVPVWDQVQFDTGTPIARSGGSTAFGTFAFNPNAVSSIAWNPVWSCYEVWQNLSGGSRLWRFTAAGALKMHPTLGIPWADDYNYITKVSGAWCDDRSSMYYLYKYDVPQTGTAWKLSGPDGILTIPNSWIVDSVDGATIAYDTTNNRFALVQTNGTDLVASNGIQVHLFLAPGTGVTEISTTNFAAPLAYQRVHGAIHGTQTGVLSWVISGDTDTNVYAFTDSGSARRNTEGDYREWTKPGAAVAFTHDGTQFVSLDSTGLLTKYTTWVHLGVDSNVWIGAAAADTDATGGQHETPVGTMRNITFPRRSKLKITMPETNDYGGTDDPDKWRLYFKRGGSTSPTDKTLLKLIGDIGDPSVPTSTTITAEPTGAAPPGGIKGQAGAVNNFPVAVAAKIQSGKTDGSGAILSMLGDGTGRWGTLTVDANGKAVIGGDTGWVNLTLTSPWASFGSPYAAPAYRKIGNQVFLRGLAQAATGTISAIATLPVGFRPAVSQLHKAIVAVVSSTFDASNDNPAAFDSGAATAGTAHTHNVNVPDIAIVTDVSFSNVAVRLNIDTAGVITPGAGTPAAQGSNFLALDGISFLVD